MRRETNFTHQSELYLNSIFNNKSFAIALTFNDALSNTTVTEIFTAKIHPPSRHNKPQILGTVHKGRLYNEKGVSLSQITFAINYRSVWSLKRGSNLVPGTL
jgi:hypothetical protein